jgi:hypothetical protein
LALATASIAKSPPNPPDGGGSTNNTPIDWEAIQAQLRTQFTNDFAPWLHPNEMTEEGLALSASFAAWQSGGATQQLFSLAQSLGNMQAAQAAEATNFAAANGWPLRMTNENNTLAILVGVENGQPVYIAPYNAAAADTVGTDELWTNGSSSLNLNGEGTQVAVWDIGDARLTHREFTTNGVRIVKLDAASPDGMQDHATHVSGTAGAYGVTAAAKGMANRGVVLYSDQRGDYDEMPRHFATNYFRLSNHSYGRANIGWYGTFNYLGTNYPVWWGDTAYSQSEDYKFGLYDTNSQSIDRIAYSSRYYLPVWAAGNERGARGKPAISQANGHIGFSNQVAYLFTGVTRPDDGGATGYDTLPPQGLAKNALTVGAVSNIVGGYAGSNTVAMSTFSSFGPADDGRIKPDVVGMGVNVYSTGSLFDSDYYTDSGTSMASPNVCGSLNLLVQLHNRYAGTNQPMLSSTLRGLAIHTADEAGTTAGPDYRFGWGLLNVLKAARLLTNNFVSGSLPFLKEVKLVNGDSIEFPVVAKGGEPLKIDVWWTDPAGNPQPTALDPTNRVLVNDVDLRVLRSGVTNFPWRLNPAAPANAATTGDNDTDNGEQVVVANPVTNGVYLVRITHKGTLKDHTGATADLWVSIFASGIVPQSEPPLAIERIAQASTNTVALRWVANVGRIYQLQHRDNVDSGTWSPATGEISATKTNVAVELPLTGSSRFYRLVRVR